MKTIINSINGIGLFLLVFGGCAMDSPNITIPIIMFVSDMFTLLLGKKLDEEFYTEK